MDTDRSGYPLPIPGTWTCGKTKAEPHVINGLVIGYRYVTIEGCGATNAAVAAHCWKCNQRRNGERTTTAA